MNIGLYNLCIVWTCLNIINDLPLLGMMYLSILLLIVEYEYNPIKRNLEKNK